MHTGERRELGQLVNNNSPLQITKSTASPKNTQNIFNVNQQDNQLEYQQQQHHPIPLDINQFLTSETPSTDLLPEEDAKDVEIDLELDEENDEDDIMGWWISKEDAELDQLEREWKERDKGRFNAVGMNGDDINAYEEQDDGCYDGCFNMWSQLKERKKIVKELLQKRKEQLKLKKERNKAKIKEQRKQVKRDTNNVYTPVNSNFSTKPGVIDYFKYVPLSIYYPNTKIRPSQQQRCLFSFIYFLHNSHEPNQWAQPITHIYIINHLENIRRLVKPLQLKLKLKGRRRKNNYGQRKEKEDWGNKQENGDLIIDKRINNDSKIQKEENSWEIQQQQQKSDDLLLILNEQENKQEQEERIQNNFESIHKRTERQELKNENKKGSQKAISIESQSGSDTVQYQNKHQLENFRQSKIKLQIRKKNKNEESPSELSSSDLLRVSSSSHLSSSSMSSSDKQVSSEEKNKELKQNNQEEVGFVRFKKQNVQNQKQEVVNNDEDQDEGNDDDDNNNQFTSSYPDQNDPDEDDDGEKVKGIKLFNIFASGNNTDWHCLISVRPPVSFGVQLNANRLSGGYPSNSEREEYKQRALLYGNVCQSGNKTIRASGFLPEPEAYKLQHRLFEYPYGSSSQKSNFKPPETQKVFGMENLINISSSQQSCEREKEDAEINCSQSLERGQGSEDDNAWLEGFRGTKLTAEQEALMKQWRDLTEQVLNTYYGREMQEADPTSERATQETKKMLKERDLQTNSMGLNSESVPKLAGVLDIPSERDIDFGGANLKAVHCRH
ncbi:MAG: hypothetical protein EZS28_027552 [Streblomastix strix]|uniref:Uncharacterized protein n=1 Tax=Streblomastix strix TaxID=222440 RepID=A0A5J4V2F4_9EUKA|nr:MAG: hypothetical protein EZS28_027552 [Streblomastix strix]